MPQNQYGYNNYNYTNSIMTVFVDGDAGANAYPVGAGITAMLIDFNGQNFWIKGTDANGVPNRLRKFKFEEVITQQPVANGNYVTKDEFMSLSKKLDQLLSELGGNK